jgi:hypothetical protein
MALPEGTAGRGGSPDPRARDGPASRPAERGPCHPESVAALAVDGSATFG